MPTYKLTYFDVRARAETSRMLFKLADQAFEDIRVKGEEWVELKPNTPMGQLPILQVDDVTLCQSNAINRYLAKKFGYAGKSELDQARVDIVADSVEDIMPKLGPLWAEKDEEKKADIQKNLRKDVLLPMFSNIQKLLEGNKNGEGFFVGDELTMADLTFVNMSTVILTFCNAPDLWDEFPKLKALKQRVEAEPKIAAWIKERPDNQY